MKSILPLLSALIVLAWAPVARGELQLENVNGKVYSLSGRVEAGDAARLAPTLAQIAKDGILMRLDSPGGNIEDAMDMARQFMDAGIATAVVNGARCASACAMLFFAGTANLNYPDPRTLYSRSFLGVHQSSYPQGADLEPNEVAGRLQIITARKYALFVRQGISIDVTVPMNLTPPERIYEISREEALEWNIITALGAEPQVVSSAPATGPSARVVGISGNCFVEAGFLNIRDFPDYETGNILGQLCLDQTVYLFPTTYDCNCDWTAIRFEDGVGYVHNDFIEVRGS